MSRAMPNLSDQLVRSALDLFGRQGVESASARVIAVAYSGSGDDRPERAETVRTPVFSQIDAILDTPEANDTP